MHYHNIFLVKSTNKIEALHEVSRFLDEFDENKEVEPYKVFLIDHDIREMKQHYKKEELEDLIEHLEDWFGYNGGIEDGKLYYLNTSNPFGKWDWYQFGGRWMWSDLIDKYYKKVVKHENGKPTGYYWNQYHDEEVKGKTWLCEFPDGSQQEFSYGDDYGIKSWVDDHPEYSEVIDATDKGFFKRLKSRRTKKSIIDEAKELFRHFKDDEYMQEYCRKAVDEAMRMDRWCINFNFWNITDNSFKYSIKEIKENPKEWFLVNVDLHS